MITKLDNKYLVLNWDDINEFLNNSEKRKLNKMLEKIHFNRAKASKIQKKYTVVSESMDIFDGVTKRVLDEINGVKSPSKIQMPINVVQQVQTGSGDNIAGDKAVVKKKSAPKKKASPKKSVFKD